MKEQKELKDLSIVELKAAAYERVEIVSRFNAELKAIQQELVNRSSPQPKTEKGKK